MTYLNTENMTRITNIKTIVLHGVAYIACDRVFEGVIVGSWIQFNVFQARVESGLYQEIG